MTAASVKVGNSSTKHRIEAQLADTTTLLSGRFLQAGLGSESCWDRSRPLPSLHSRTARSRAGLQQEAPLLAGLVQLHSCSRSPLLKSKHSPQLEQKPS